MTYEEICPYLAAHYDGFTAEVVANMTPRQTQVYMNAIPKLFYGQDGQAQPQKPMTNAELVQEAARMGLPSPKNY